MDWDLTEPAFWKELTAHGDHDLRVPGLDVRPELSFCLELARSTTCRPYGALLTSAPPPSTAGRLLTSSLDPDELRRGADGRTLLVSHWPAAPAHLLQLAQPLHTDEDGAALVAHTGGVLFRTAPNGRVWVVGPTCISCIQDGELWTRAHLADLIESLLPRVPGGDPGTLRAVAALAYSHAGPGPTGATLVYQPARRGDEKGRFGGVAVECLGLDVNDRAHLGAILHQLEHRDGALVFGRTGTLLRTGAILVPSPAAVAAVGPVRGGTRHHSAAWHSYDRPDVLCFAVSRTGRVTIFSRGKEVPAALALQDVRRRRE